MLDFSYKALHNTEVYMQSTTKYGPNFVLRTPYLMHQMIWILLAKVGSSNLTKELAEKDEQLQMAAEYGQVTACWPAQSAARWVDCRWYVRVLIPGTISHAQELMEKAGQLTAENEMLAAGAQYLSGTIRGHNWTATRFVYTNVS